MTHDPDLMQAIEDLHHVVMRIRQLESQVADAINNPLRYNQLVAAQQDRADKFDEVRARAERLNMPARSLMLIVEEWWRLQGRNRRKPDARSVEVAVRTAAEHAEVAEREATAEFEFARIARQQATARSTAAAAALAYIRLNQKAAA